MKIIYCIRATYNPGGMERVLLNKVSYLVKQLNWDVTIVTTDQQGRPSFYPFPKGIRMIDLNINYADYNEKNILSRINGYLRCRKKHKNRLTALLEKEKADIVVSLYPSESSFIPDIQDGSKKVLELHFCKHFRIQYGRHGILGIIDKLRTKQDELIVRKFDKFIVLTKEDSVNWGHLENLEIIYNAIPVVPNKQSSLEAKRVIAVGRLDYQKGFDNLIDIWLILVRKYPITANWKLDIFGQGEWKEMLENKIKVLNLCGTITIHPPTNDITIEYLNSSILAMTSNYEGFGMVLVEALACGLPCVAYSCPCGPSEIIKDGENGFVRPLNDKEGFADALHSIISNAELRRKMGNNARKSINCFSQDIIMAQWINLFNSLI